MRLLVAGASMLAGIDSTWPELRPEDSFARGWKWYSIGEGAEDRFAVANDGGVVAVWAAKRQVELPSGNFYRLDYIEVHPAMAGRGFGTATMHLVCARAAELGSNGVVLGSVPDEAAKRFYAALGAEQESPEGWRPMKGLVPFWLQMDVMAAMSEVANELRS